MIIRNSSGAEFSDRETLLLLIACLLVVCLMFAGCQSPDPFVPVPIQTSDSDPRNSDEGNHTLLSRPDFGITGNLVTGGNGTGSIGFPLPGPEPFAPYL